MAKRRSVEDDVAAVFEHWSISDKAKQELTKLYTRTEQDPGVEEVSSETGGQAAPTAPPEGAGGREAPPPPRPAISDRQLLTVKTSASRPVGRNRVFKRRPDTTAEGELSELKNNIPKRHFFSYYNALHDVVLPQVDKKSRLLLCALFRRAHGFNRNWCRISFPELLTSTGTTTNTLRSAMRHLLENGWVAIVSDSYHNATTYVLNIPADTLKEDDTQDEGDGDPQKLRVNPRGSKTPSSPPSSDPQNLPPCTSSTPTGHMTGQEPVTNPEVKPNSVRPPKTTIHGENRVSRSAASRIRLEPEAVMVAIQNGEAPYLTEQEESYVRARPSHEQSEIFDAQDAWDEVLGVETRPTASKLNEMMDHIREFKFNGGGLDGKFRECLEKTKLKQPEDPVAWMVSALKNGRYP